ncbi:MAG TPA: hypothetical protein VME41_05475 [Stellaceae bacterium]|nr:hypothetical protein [Stellaceae bacterium]
MPSLHTPTVEYLVKDLLYDGVSADQLQQQFNDEFAKSGWELVSVLPRNAEFLTFIFKRVYLRYSLPEI